MAISSGLKIVESTRLRRVCRLVVPGEVLVAKGDLVEPDTVVARAEFMQGTPYVVDLNAELKQVVTPEFVDSVLLKKVGDKVEAKEVIAKHQKRFWSEITEARSPCTGTIEYISRIQGRVIIREDPRSAKPMSIVAAASKLGVWPRLLRMYTEVKEGDQVFEGQVIAAAPGVGTVDYVYAPMAGVVERICTQTGTVTIVRPIKPTQVVAHIHGRVEEIIPDAGCIVGATGSYMEGVFGIGGERHGVLVTSSDGPGSILDEAGVPENTEGKILVAGSLVSLGAIQKARQRGATGIVTGGVNNLDLVQILGKEISVGMTGLEDGVDFTVVVMEGFGEMPMNERAWSILACAAGRLAFVDGTTQIRAGVIRPEIMISEGAELLTEAELPATGEERLFTSVSLQVGQRVRCVRAPYFGQWGVVHEIPPELQAVENEGLMEVARVHLDDGRLVTVAEANLEVFE